MQQQKLWTRNFTLIIVATTFGALGWVAGEFALSFFVFDETGSTLASALIMAVQFIPRFLVPIVVAPIMDRLPRKTFLVAGDVANGTLFVLVGLWLQFNEFSYIGYLVVSIILASIGSIDELAYTSLYPDLIPDGMEQKGYAVSSMLYPVISVVMTPLAAILMDTIGVAMILVIQGALSLLAAFTENLIRVDESSKKHHEESYTPEHWLRDVKEAGVYLKDEPGLRRIFEYSAISNGLAMGAYPLLIAFFRTAPGFNPSMYALFSVVEFIGRSIGSAIQYRIYIPPEKRLGFVFFVYQFYDIMDAILLWIPYPAMLVNRTMCGLLGSNSMIIRESSVQSYLPENLRSRVNAVSNILFTVLGGIFTLFMGWLGEILDYRICFTVNGLAAVLASWTLIWGGRRYVRAVYESVGSRDKDERAGEAEHAGTHAGSHAEEFEK